MTNNVVALRPETDGLELLERAKALLAEASSVDEVKDVRDRAEAIRVYALARGASEAAIQAMVVKLRAERRAGELLADAVPHEGGRPNGNNESPLSSLGIAKHQSSRWQRIAQLPEVAFETYLEHCIEDEKEPTTTAVLKLAKQTREPVGPDGYPPLPDQTFRTITADPPWRYGNTSTRGAAQDHYDTLSIEQLSGKELMPDGTNLAEEVQSRLAEDAHLYLWTTAGHLPDAFSVMESWGFTYKTYLVWVKRQMGMGNYFRVSTEMVLFGVKGNMRTNDRGIRNDFNAPRGKHSAKPESFYDDLVMKASPGPYMEMFTRCRREQQLVCGCTRCRLNWTVWGNEA